MKSIITVLSIISIPAIATELLTEYDGNAILAVPATIHSTLTREASESNLKCDEVIAKLSRNKNSILRCLDGAEAPRNFCQLLKGDLTRTLSNAEESVGEIEQRWVVSVAATSPTKNELDAFISATGAATDQVILAKVSQMKMDEPQMEFKEGSYSELLSRASILDLKPRYQFSSANQTLSLRTLDRLTPCELETGEIEIKTKVTVHYAYGIVKDQNERGVLWKLRKTLQTIKDKPYTERQKYILAGFHFADHFANEQRQASEAEVLSISSIFLKDTPDVKEFSLREYRNEFHFGQFLPQMAKTFTKQFEVSGSVQ